jgi:hypothetical protein
MNDIWNTRKNSFINILQSIFISLEFLATIVLYILYFLRIIEFNKIGYFLFNNNEIVMGVTIIFPITLFCGSLKFQKVLLQPEDNNKILYNWPDYDKFKVTTYVGIIFCILPIIPTFISWANFSYYCTYDVGFYYVLLTAISFISVAGLYASQYEIKRILQK